MKNLYSFAVNVLVFFFIQELFSSVMNIGKGSFYEKLLYAVVFAGIMYFVPHILQFFKIPVTEVSEFIVGSALSFLFFFLGYYMFGFIDIVGYVFDPKIPVIEPINFVDKSVALLIIGGTSALLAIGIKALSNKKRRSYSSY